MSECTNADEGLDYLWDEESIAEVANPLGGEGAWLGFGDRFTLGFGGTHWHYEPYEGDYLQLKVDIRAILSGGLVVLSSRAGEGDWKGVRGVEGGVSPDADGWALLRAMKLGPEYEGHYAELGGTVEVASWLPELCRTVRVEPRR